MSRTRSPGVSADTGDLQWTTDSHSLPEMLREVHLGLRENFVDDGLGDPALLTEPLSSPKKVGVVGRD